MCVIEQTELTFCTVKVPFSWRKVFPGWNVTYPPLRKQSFIEPQHAKKCCSFLPSQELAFSFIFYMFRLIIFLVGEVFCGEVLLIPESPPPPPSKPVLLNPGSPCSPSWRANLVISNVNSFQLALYTNVLKVLEWLVTSENISPCRYARSSSSIGVTFQFIFFFTFQPVFSLHFCPSTLAVKNTFFYQIRGAEKNAWNCCQPP